MMEAREELDAYEMCENRGLLAPWARSGEAIDEFEQFQFEARKTYMWWKEADKKVNDVVRRGKSRMIEVGGFPMHIVVRAEREETAAQVTS